MVEQRPALKKRVLTTGILFMLVVPWLYAAQSGIDVTIRYFNQNVVFPDSKVPVRIEITNNSPQSFHFQLAGQRAFDLSFDVRSLTNIAVPESSKFIMARNTNQPVFFRDVTLGPGEQFSFVEDLSDYVDLQAKDAGPGVYIVQASFYPSLYSPGATDVIKSNVLTLNVEPGATPVIQAMINMTTGEILKAEALPPDEVVAYVLRARQKSEWNKFFLYIDVKNLMLQQPELQRRYVRSSDTQQRDMVAAFKKQLEQNKVDNEILVVPNTFTIEKTSYTSTEATVQVLEKFVYPTYSELKQYTYYLHRPENVWLIYNYTVRNLGTQ